MNRVVVGFSRKGEAGAIEEKFRNSLSQDRRQERERWCTRRYGSSKTIEKVYSAGWKYPVKITSCIRVRGRFGWVYVTHDAHRQLFPLSYTKFTIRYYRTPVVGKAVLYIPARRKFIEFIGPRKFIDPDKSLSAK